MTKWKNESNGNECSLIFYKYKRIFIDIKVRYPDHPPVQTTGTLNIGTVSTAVVGIIVQVQKTNLNLQLAISNYI